MLNYPLVSKDVRRISRVNMWAPQGQGGVAVLSRRLDGTEWPPSALSGLCESMKSVVLSLSLSRYCVQFPEPQAEIDGGIRASGNAIRGVPAKPGVPASLLPFYRVYYLLRSRPP